MENMELINAFIEANAANAFAAQDLARRVTIETGIDGDTMFKTDDGVVTKSIDTLVNEMKTHMPGYFIGSASNANTIHDHHDDESSPFWALKQARIGQSIPGILNMENLDGKKYRAARIKQGSRLKP